MRRTLIAVAVAVASLTSLPAMAATVTPGPLSFHFQFTDTLNRAGLVEGIIEGLSDNATGPGTVSLITQAGGTFTAPPEYNQFTVADGEMGVYSFHGTGPGSPVPGLQLDY